VDAQDLDRIQGFSKDTSNAFVSTAMTVMVFTAVDLLGNLSLGEI
jgi:hypothetical protein